MVPFLFRGFHNRCSFIICRGTADETHIFSLHNKPTEKESLNGKNGKKHCREYPVGYLISTAVFLLRNHGSGGFLQSFLSPTAASG